MTDFQNILAAQIMKEPIAITKNFTLFDAIKKLVYHNISRLVVKDDEKPVGIITEKDIGFYIYYDKTAQSLEQIQVTKVMKKIKVYDDSQSLKGCAEVMFENNIGSLVIGSKNKLQGIVTKTDIIRFISLL
jgi:CBS domain-containing protein